MDGEVVVSYRYKAQGSNEYTYGLSNALPSGNVPYRGEATYSFSFPTSILSGASDIQYTLVFEGTLGKEDGAVIGKVLDFWVEDWQRGLTGSHHWHVLPPAGDLSVTAETVSNPDGTLGDKVVYFKIMNSNIAMYYDAILTIYLYLSGEEGADRIISTDEFDEVTTGFFIPSASPVGSGDMLYLEISLKDPVSGKTTTMLVGESCWVNGCNKDRWLWHSTSLPQGYIVTSMAVWLEFSPPARFDRFDFLANDIIFHKRYPQ
jgi:hypothetical protein